MDKLLYKLDLNLHARDAHVFVQTPQNTHKLQPQC